MVLEPKSIVGVIGGARVYLIGARVYLVGARVYLSLVILVSALSQLDFWIWDFFRIGTSSGLDLGLGLDNFI